MGLITVDAKTQSKLFFKLIREFSKKVVLPRGFKSTTIFKEFQDKGLFGIVDAVQGDDKEKDIYDVYLPDVYLEFIRYILENPSTMDQNLLTHTD